MKKTLFILFLLIISSGYLYSQNPIEYYFKFKIDNQSELDTITQIISIDNVKDLEVYAYAMQDELDEFKKLGYKIEFLQKDIPKSITMATTVSEMDNWNRYPTYEVYRQMMKNFESDYPSLCKLDSIGTTNNGRQLYILKISDNVNTEESEPEFFYTSTMHGDETTGFILLLRLVDSLLSTYGPASQVTNLVNEVEIFINPNANPDGTYYGGNNTVSGAIRSNGVADINRDFPDPRIGANSPYQPETQAMMDFAEQHHFVMSANFHGGAEVLNYPWDTWYNSENPHADTYWFEFVCTNYVTTARTIYSNYLKSVTSDGVTHGATWYKVAGGRQDYMNYWHQCREVTVELSTTKLLPVESLNNFWNYNKQSLLNYMNECLYGIRGTVKNLENNPLKAMIEIIGHDQENDSSMVFTDPDKGDYHRLIEAGTYDIVASADGYNNDTIKDVEVNWSDVTWVNFTLLKPEESNDSISLSINPELIEDTLFFDQSNSHKIIIKNDSNAVTTNYSIDINNPSTNQWISLNKSSGNLYGTQNDTVITTINTNELVAGNYSTYILLTADDNETDTLFVNLLVKDTISTSIKPKQIIDTLWAGNSNQYNIYIENSGLMYFNYNIQIDDQASHEWLSINKNSGSLSITDTDTVVATVETSGFGFGSFEGNLIIEKENSTNDTISLLLFVKDTISISIEPEQIIDTLWAGENSFYQIFLKNTGLLELNYNLHIDNQSSSEWLSIDKTSESLSLTEIDTINATVETSGLGFGNLNSNLIIEKEDNTNDTIKFLLIVKDTLTYEINPLFFIDTLNQDINKDYYLYIKNTGKSDVEYVISIDFPTKADNIWINLNQNSGSVLVNKEDSITVTINTIDLEPNDYSCQLTINLNERDSYEIPVGMHVNQIQSATNPIELDNVNIYPNPFNHEIVLSFNYLSNKPIYLSLISISGSILYKQKIESLYKGQNLIILDNDEIINLPKGIYLLKLSTSNYKVIKKVVKD